MKMLGRNLANDPHRLFTPEAAEKAASELKEGDPDWDYRPVHDPAGTGLSFVEIFDEEGEFVARLT
jgi:hypothetical protein